jgi:LysR family transcriptional activator of nhaA
MDPLNFHHLRYFHAVVRQGSLTAAANSLHVSQSALSIQIRKLEDHLGCTLFDRQHKRMHLTEEGKIILDYAETIFRTSEEMLATLQNKSQRFRNTLRVGAVSTLSSNFQLSFLQPALDDQDLEVVIHSASLRVLMTQLNAHTIDLVLSNNPVMRDQELKIHCQQIAEQPVSLVAPPNWIVQTKFNFPQDLQQKPMVLPGLESTIRASFDLIMEQSGIAPLIAAEADSMAMLRLIARETKAITLVPPVVVQDELRNGRLVELYQIPNIHESFYAITTARRYPNPYLKDLLQRSVAGMVGNC